MKQVLFRGALRRMLCVLPVWLCVLSLAGFAQDRRKPEVALPVFEERVVGPYDVHVLEGGPALLKPVPAASEVLRGGGAYTLSLWVRLTQETPRSTLFAGVGDAQAENSHFLGMRDGFPILRYGEENFLESTAALPAAGWHQLVATSDGSVVILIVDGKPVGQKALLSGEVAPRLTIAPTAILPDLAVEHFGGDLARVTLLPRRATTAEIASSAEHSPATMLLEWTEASLPWPVQTRAFGGYIEPEDPSLLPTGIAPYSKPFAKPLPSANAPALVPLAKDEWALRSQWKLTAAPSITGAGGQLSQAGFDDRQWMAATVPGTVLTSMIDRGIYPDPDFGLNNMLIPESLNKQDYWYRIEFDSPAEAERGRTELTFLGINYAAEVWLNGKELGGIRGAFLRGQFDVTDGLLRHGKNALAVRISPPPHPGYPEEESLKAGPGENGGAMCLDGPTFVATEGWDWIPSIRDRNSGIWQDVVLAVSGEVRLGDPRVVTHLPLPSTASAEVTIDVPLTNASSAPIATTVRAEFEGVTVEKTVQAAPGDSIVTLAPAEFPQLHLNQPRLWWPNGYGSPDLYHLKLSTVSRGREMDEKKLTFGVREVTYELSLFDHAGRLARREVDPTPARQQGIELVDVHHHAMRQTAEYWAPSLTAAGELSPDAKPVTGEDNFTDLVIKVNGVRIAARGGNWGMDDSRKRVSREHLEPFFRLHREANLNIIRNWVGQNSEEVFYQLADEYGLMVWNDFWESTQDYNLEAQDVPLFLANARDVVRRFRNHPSIVVWCGRNEGVPQPILNDGLISMLQAEDGTRYYTPGSNRIDLRNSGPYLYQDPALYYTKLDKGFSVELGTSSLSTLESLRASIAPDDQWPISDSWAYHDWHQSGNGDVHPMEEHLEEQFGAAHSLPDFERKAQMLNYVDHRAIFEGFNQHLFAPNSGRMLWMTQPAWPSNEWQILSSDYDTQASYYAVKKACEPLHLQLDLSDFRVTGVNTSGQDAMQLMASASIYDLSGKQLASQQSPLALPSNRAVPLFALNLASYFGKGQTVLVLLQMTDSGGAVVSRNVYWLAGKESDLRAMSQMAPANVAVSAVPREQDGESVLDLTLRNQGTTPALAAKLTLMNSATHQRILPAYYSDNYVSMLPGETLHMTVRYPRQEGKHLLPELGLRGWNVTPTVVKVSPTR
jgi:hypothetical protein